MIKHNKYITYDKYKAIIWYTKPRTILSFKSRKPIQKFKWEIRLKRWIFLLFTDDYIAAPAEIQKSWNPSQNHFQSLSCHLAVL